MSQSTSGFLSGKVRARDKYVGDDVRRVITRFDDENVKANQPLVELLQRLAEEKGATPAQVSLAWMLAKWPFVTPIPGSRKAERIEEELVQIKIHGSSAAGRSRRYEPECQLASEPLPMISISSAGQSSRLSPGRIRPKPSTCSGGSWRWRRRFSNGATRTDSCGS